MSVLFDPGRIRQAEWTMSELPGAAPATDHDEGSPRVVISGLNRTAFDLAVYASQGWQGHRIKIGGLGRMANSAFGGKLNLCGTCSHLCTMFVVYLVVDNKYNVYVR